MFSKPRKFCLNLFHTFSNMNILSWIYFFVENLPEGQKKSNYQSKSPHNLETLGTICKKNATLLQTPLLKNCGRIGEFIPKT